MAAPFFLDGETAARLPVQINLTAGHLVLSLTDGEELTRWALDSIYVQRDLPTGGSVLLGPRDGLARVLVDDAALIAHLRDSVPTLSRGPSPGRQARNALGWGIAALASVFLMMFLFLPLIADRLAARIPPDREAALGKIVVDGFADFHAENAAAPFCTGAEGQRALEALVARLSENAPNALPDLTVRVLDSDIVNAFAAPGGQIVVFRGLIEQAGSIEELAGILAHELGHVASRDPTRLMMRAAGSAGLLGLLFGDVTGGTIVLTISDRLIQASYTRDAEAAADDFALEALAGAGMSSAGLASFFERLIDDDAEAGEFGALLQSHPDLAARAQHVRKQEVGDFAALPVQQWQAISSICKP